MADAVCKSYKFVTQRPATQEAESPLVWFITPCRLETERIGSSDPGKVASEKKVALRHWRQELAW
jgi:hypothetical protein